MSSEKSKIRKPWSFKDTLIAFAAGFFAIFDVLITLLSYFSYRGNIYSASVDQAKYSCQQGYNTINNYFINIEETGNNATAFLESYESIVDLSSAAGLDSLHDELNDCLEFSPMVNGIAFYKQEGNMVSSAAEERIEMILPASYKEAIENQSKYFFTYSSEESGTFYALKGCDYYFGTKMEKGFFLIVSKSYRMPGGASDARPTDSLKNKIGMTLFSSDFTVLLTSYDDEKILSALNEFCKNNTLGYYERKIDSTYYVMSFSSIDDSDIFLLMTLDNTDVHQAFRTFNISLIAIMIGSYSLFILAFFFLLSILLKPMSALEKQMGEGRTDEKSNMVIPPPLKGSKEIQSLDNAYLALLNKINSQIRVIALSQEEKRKAELTTLQNQINPHFLYNTLDSIIYMIDSSRYQEAEKMIYALSDFFRISISRGQEVIPVEKELEHVKNYLIIQKMRFGDSFNYSIEAGEEMKDYQVIKLILQPIVENAIMHGFDQQGKKGALIKVSAKLKDGFIVFSIQDNGYGILPEKVSEIEKSFTDSEVQSGIGLKNVYQRIKVFYGERAGLEIKTVLDEGTDIVISIPASSALIKPGK